MSRLIEAPERRIIVHDTTLRDGNQDGRSEFSVAGKLVVIQSLDVFGVDYIEAGWPDSNDNDKVLFQEAKNLPLRHAKLIAFGRTAKAGVSPENDDVLDALLNAGTSIVALVGKADPLNVTDGLRTTLEENLRMIQRSTEHLRKEGKRVTFDAEHFFDGYERNPEYSLKTLEAAIAGGAEVLTLCDTNGRMHYTDVRKVTEVVRERFPNMPLGIHVHNNKGLALPATLEAIEAGATQVQGVVNGSGEWAGNVDLVQVVAHLHSDRYKMQTNVDLTKTPQVTRAVAEQSGIPVPANQPFSGEQVWTRNAALHAVSWLREPKTYWYDDAEKYGREDEVGFSDQGGGANVLWWAEKLGFTLNREDQAYQKIFDEMKRKRPWGKAQIFLLYYREITGEPAPFEVLESQVVDVRDKPSHATVKVRVNGNIYEEQAESEEGLINAFDLALRKALSHKYPEVENVALVQGGYKNTSKGGRDTAATVTVEFQLIADDLVWNTKIRGGDQQRTGEDALIDGYKYYILRENMGNRVVDSDNPYNPTQVESDTKYEVPTTRDQHSRILPDPMITDDELLAWDQVPLENMHLKPKFRNALLRSGVRHVGTLLRMDEFDFARLKQVGLGVAQEVGNKLQALIDPLGKYPEGFIAEMYEIAVEEVKYDKK